MFAVDANRIEIRELIAESNRREAVSIVRQLWSDADEREVLEGIEFEKWDT